MPKNIVTMSLMLASAVCAASEPPQDVKAPIDAAAEQQSKPLPIKAPMLAKEDATEIKVIVEKNRTVEEYRHRGELIMVKVIPNKGKPYYIDPLENRQQGSAKELMDAGVKPVHWVIKEF
ncbi:DUF2782 domain-containing protein [Marinicella rhabdoformis]|uniref:DUF2782 domain-containing protein n=1 Tax=Marinicella rhabdoformis TaxID=2580566 RepID=UPI0012AED51D|nr:DUF2782 domain-containing protein [Marinicella rhabdoformis]